MDPEDKGGIDPNATPPVDDPPTDPPPAEFAKAEDVAAMRTELNGIKDGMGSIKDAIIANRAAPAPTADPAWLRPMPDQSTSGGSV